MRLSRKLKKVIHLSILCTAAALIILVYWKVKYQRFSKRILPTQETIQSSEFLTYVNKIANYSFQYSPNETVESARGYEGPPEKSETILITDKANNNVGLMDISIEIPPSCCNYDNEQEAIGEIVDYWSSSTSHYPFPEKNKVIGPIESKANVNKLYSRSVPIYRYEINWEDSDKGRKRNGSDVWLLIPISVNWQLDPNRLGWLNEEKYIFLWLEYDKRDEKRLLPILNSFSLHTKI